MSGINWGFVSSLFKEGGRGNKRVAEAYIEAATIEHGTSRRGRPSGATIHLSTGSEIPAVQPAHTAGRRGLLHKPSFISRMISVRRTNLQQIVEDDAALVARHAEEENIAADLGMDLHPQVTQYHRSLRQGS